MSEPGKSPRHFSNAFKERMVLRLEAVSRIAARNVSSDTRRTIRRDRQSLASLGPPEGRSSTTNLAQKGRIPFSLRQSGAKIDPPTARQWL
jgi:transposase-like protein